jgi:2-amino-4-hydroxy-6-hydroxymethyldihydropteridine diphosphokinase
MENVHLLLGTNVGDLEENLARALDAIEERNLKILKKSRIYKTKAWGVAQQPDYLNLALEVATDLTPRGLLSVLKNIEAEMGRRAAKTRYEPRIIDIDIIFWGDQIVDHPDLKIPHGEFHNRPFAMKILSEIAPDFVPPGSEHNLQELSSGASNEGIEIYRN